MASNYDANLIIIGAGSGGLTTAYIAAAIKAKVILIEKSDMGGDCLNTGCVPSKSLIASAKLLHEMQHADKLGLKPVKAEFEFSEVMDRVHSIIASIAPHDSVERYTQLGVDVIKGEARILSPNTVSVNGKTVSANSIVIAAGAEPIVPAIDGIEDINYYTSDTIWQLRELPKRMVIIGGGPVGCELAQCFNRFGSEVTMIQKGAHIMIREDEEFATAMADTFVKEGINLLINHQVMRFEVKNNQKRLICQHGNQQVFVEFDEILLALGRAARLEDYGLDELKIPLSTNGTIETNEYLQAGYNNIYAVGDVTGPYQFTHSASHQAWHACVNALFSPLKKLKIDYSVLPWTTYTDPEVARVGLNEMAARQKNVPYEVTTYDLAELDRAKTEGHDYGRIKVLTAPSKDKILGVTIMGRHAGDLIAEFVLAMRYGLGLNKILGTIHAYPTWMEANKNLAGQWKKNHAPQWILKLLEKYHQLRR